MATSIIRSILLGLKRRSRRGLTAALSTIGTIWLLTEIGTSVSTEMKAIFDANHGIYLSIVWISSLIVFILYIYEPHSISFSIPTTATTVNIKFGDIFEEEADLLLAANEFFDHSLGQVVSRESVHGRFIQKEFGSDEVRFRQALDNVLPQGIGEPTTRLISPSVKYPIGTTAMLPIGARFAFLVALTHTDLTTAKASTSVEEHWVALRGAWQVIHSHGNGRPIALPLIGNGRSSLNLAPQHLLRLIVLSLVDFARKTGLPNHVTIVAPDDCFEHLDIREIARDWKRE